MGIDAPRRCFTHYGSKDGKLKRAASRIAACRVVAIENRNGYEVADCTPFGNRVLLRLLRKLRSLCSHSRSACGEVLPPNWASAKFLREINEILKVPRARMYRFTKKAP